MSRDFPLLALAALAGVIVGRVARRSGSGVYPMVVGGVVMVLAAAVLLYVLRVR